MYTWIPESAVLAIYAELMAEYGGAMGSVNKNQLGSTLARPMQIATYANPAPDVFQLAAAYGFGFAKNHCFTDGNKRIALTVIDVFLQLNGHELTTSEPEAVSIIRALAASEFDENDLSEWIRKNSVPFDINNE